MPKHKRVQTIMYKPRRRTNHKENNEQQARKLSLNKLKDSAATLDNQNQN